ncbi:MAG: hypothetical protein OEW60_05025 [Thiovulaceae bacterium]|nr:hypothetical protein [Sulfurimonadaceae bacterium]
MKSSFISRVWIIVLGFVFFILLLLNSRDYFTQQLVNVIPHTALLEETPLQKQKSACDLVHSIKNPVPLTLSQEQIKSFFFQSNTQREHP